MTQSAPVTPLYQPMLDNKTRFFSGLLRTQTTDGLEWVATKVREERIMPIGIGVPNPAHHRFVAENRDLIEQELRDLLAVLKENPKPRTDEAYWFYCYYCCLILESYYQGYGKRDKSEEYRKKGADIEARFSTAPAKADAPKTSFWRTFQEQLIADVSAIASTPLHISEIRNWVALANITRLQIAFSRILVMESLVWANKFAWISNIDGMLNNLSKPSTALNVLSVGLFAARFLINSAMILKHTFVPTDEEKSLTMYERFTLELKKRHCDLLNDAVWSLINGLSNYAPQLGISNPVAYGLLAGFLVFDVAMCFHRWRLAKIDYQLKRAQYEAELKGLTDDSPASARQMLLSQQAQLESSWRETNATFAGNVTAAMILFTGFTAYLLLMATPLAPVCFLVCCAGISMYLSAHLWGAYHEKCYALNELRDLSDVDEVSRQALQKAETEMLAARNAFIFSMVKNTVMPALIMATFAVCWPAAVALTVLYIAYEVTKGYWTPEPDQPQPGVNPPTLAFGAE